MFVKIIFFNIIQSFSGHPIYHWKGVSFFKFSRQISLQYFLWVTNVLHKRRVNFQSTLCVVVITRFSRGMIIFPISWTIRPRPCKSFDFDSAAVNPLVTLFVRVIRYREIVTAGNLSAQNQHGGGAREFSTRSITIIAVEFLRVPEDFE